MTWSLKRDAWFIKQGVRPIECSTHVRLYCCRFELFELIFTYLCIIQEKKIVMCQLQNAKSNFPNFCKFYARQKSKKKNLVHLAEASALILNS